MPQLSESARRRSSRQRARRLRVLLAWSIAAAGAIVALFGDASPTSVEVADAAYRGLYVLGVGLACAFARRWTWPIVAGVAMAAGPQLPWAVAGGIALLIAAVSQLDRRRRQPVGAVVGVLSALALLHLPELVAFGVPSLIAALAPLPSAVSALGKLRSQVRRPALVAAGVVAGVAAAVVVAFGVGVLLLRSDANRGVSAARSGLDALRAGEQEQAASQFASAAEAFGEANGIATAWWMAPGRVVPVLGQHLDVARQLTEEGGELADVSARTAPAVSLDDLTADDGTFRLDRIAEIQPLAADALAALEAGQDRLDSLSDDWLTGPMVGAVEALQDEVGSSVPDARLAVEALELAPGLLGADGTKRYVVLFGNPAEAREMGGFVASIGVLTADQGRLDFSSLPTPGQLRPALEGVDLSVEVPAGFANSRPATFVENWTESPDIQTVASVVGDLFPAVAGVPADGVLYVDPYVLAALLQLTGPVTVEEGSRELTAENVVDFLLRDQYQSPDFEPGGERKERLGDAGEIAFDRLVGGALPRPRVLSDVLSPLVRARRLQFTTTDPAAHDLLRTIGLRPDVDQGDTETILVANEMRRPGKLDAYLERDIRYQARVGEDGTLDATVTVRLTNRAPRTGLADYQLTVPNPAEELDRTTNLTTLDVFSAFPRGKVTIDGVEAGFNQTPGYDLHQYAVAVEVPAGVTVEVVLRFAGTVDPDACSFAFVPNAGAGVDHLQVSIDLPQGPLESERAPLAQRVTLSCS